MELLRVSAAVMLVLALTGCPGGRRSGTPGVDCPDVSGTWQITDHCESSSVGTTVTVSQSGCSFSSSWGGSAPGSGSIDSAGRVNMTVDIGEEILTCAGSSTTSSFTVDCTPGGCHVELAKSGGGTRDSGGGGGRDAGGGGGSAAPGSACTCDSDCAGGSNPVICVGGVCMSLATGACTEPGSPDGCPAGHRCWGNGAMTYDICWPDCSSYSCVGECDADGSCTPSATTSCNPECGTICDTGGA